jgi:hypothetical protein
MTRQAQFRQRIAEMRARLDAIIAKDSTHTVPEGRKHIDTTGNKSQTQGFKTQEGRLMAYAERRYTSVARVCVLLALVRDAPGLALAGATIDHAGAYWQAFGGNKDFHACHTCPALLTFNGLLPTVLTTNRGLQRLLVVEFADCMLMPKSINGIDKLVDEQFAREAFVQAARHILDTPGAGWEDGMAVFDDWMGDIYENAREALFAMPVRHSPRPPEQEALLDTLCAYYEGMEASRRNRQAIENFRREAMQECGLVA